MRISLDEAYMRMAEIWSLRSHCDRKKVGAILVKNGRIISDGYNGTSAGEDNCCEDDSGKTKPTVLHAEANAILKIASSEGSSEGATFYQTLSPCLECAKLIKQAKISRVVYRERYRDPAGIDYLIKRGVSVECIGGEASTIAPFENDCGCLIPKLFKKIKSWFK